MNWFYNFCVMFLPGILAWHFFFIFCMQDGRVQKIRVRKSLNRIYEYTFSKKEPGHVQPEVEVTYKNKTFKVGIIKNEVNYCYTKYDIFINGDLAGHYHKLTHSVLCSYYFQEANHRDESEVIAIVHAAARSVKKLEKDTTEKPVKLNYSYFK